MPARASHLAPFVIPFGFASPIIAIFGSPDCLNSLDDFTGALRTKLRSARPFRAASKRKEDMRILLFNPDNGVTRNFMPHLWMFLLKALTPPEHEVLLIDGNAKPLNDRELVRYIKEENIGLVGIGAMTRMVQKSYRLDDVVRAGGIPIGMGGPHVTEAPDKAM